MFISHNLEAGKAKIKMLSDLVFSEGLLPDGQTASFLLYPHMVERGVLVSLPLLLKALISSLGHHPHDSVKPNYFSKNPLCNTITLGGRTSTYAFWGYTHLVHSTSCDILDKLLSLFKSHLSVEPITEDLPHLAVDTTLGSTIISEEVR